MTRHSRKPRADFALVQLLPNMLTIAAIGAGLSAIRFGVAGNFTLAVQFIAAACVLDGLDGRMARYLGSDSQMGAELDSLADFLNFGVAPPLLIYYWALQDQPGLGWMSVLFFSVCCVLRLARFNVTSKADEKPPPREHFTGVPAPAGALLVLLPMYASFAVGNHALVPDLLVMAYMALVGLLLISTIPTLSPKSVRISRGNVRYFLLGSVFVGAAFLTYAWITLVALCLAYITLVAWGLLSRRRRKII